MDIVRVLSGNPRTRSNSDHSRRQWAALLIQRKAIKAFRFNDGERLKRSSLRIRLVLERDLLRGLKLMAAFVCLFGLLIVGNLFESESNAISIHDAYMDILDLRRSSELVKTLPSFQNFLQVLSAKSKQLQPSSGVYFRTRAECKVLSGIHAFSEPLQIRVGDKTTNVDTPSFSISAWVESSKKPGGFILRKTLGDSASSLSCWGWYFGVVPRLDFGGHDFGYFEQSGQESVEIPGWPWKGGLHMQTLVVDDNIVRFYQDKDLVAEVTLRRPITDCSSNMLELGANRMRLGEVVFHPRALTVQHIGELYHNGLTLTQITSGNQPYAVDLENSSSSKDQSEDLETLLDATAREHVATRAAVAIWNADTSSLATAGARDPNCSRFADGDCGAPVIAGVAETLQVDERLGALFCDLLPEGLLGGMASGSRAHVDLAKKRHTYEASSFPRVGSAWTLSWWSLGLTTSGNEATLIGVFKDAVSELACWSVAMRPGSIRVYSEIDGVTVPVFRFQMPVEVDAGDVLLLGGHNLRHMAIAINESARSGSFYLDGVLIATSQLPASFASSLDCELNDSYVAFAHRPPGKKDWKGYLQQLRLYFQMLSPPQIFDIAYNSYDPNTRLNLRECNLPHEGADSPVFQDLSGHDCEWYSQAILKTPGACENQIVRASCPMACGVGKPCFSRSMLEEAASAYLVWERVQWISPPADAATDHSVCIASTYSYDAALNRCSQQKTLPAYASLLQDEAEDVFLNVSDCDGLRASLNSYCTFKTPGDWTSSFGEAAAASGGFTLTFWVRAARAVESKFLPSVQFFSELSPPEVLLSVFTTSGSDARVTAILHRRGGRAIEKVELAGSLKANKWTQLAVTFGASDAQGRKVMSLLVNTRYASDALDDQSESWNPPSSGNFLQAIVASGDVLIAGVEFRAAPMAIRELQDLFYKRISAMRLRTGPKRTDEARLGISLTYDRKGYSPPGFLLAPPLLLQSRDSQSTQCGSKFASYALQRYWQNIVDGPTCSEPFQCSRDLLESPLALFACSSNEERTDPWFGREASIPTFGALQGQQSYAEFLSVVADVPIVIREGVARDTSMFVDAQTKMVNIIFIIAAPRSGVLSLLEVRADMRGASFDVEYEFSQLTSIEGESLRSAIIAYSFALVISIFLLISNSRRMLQLWRAQRASRSSSEVCTVILDLLLSANVVIYCIQRMVFNVQSSGILLSVIEQLMATPWTSTEIDLLEKTQIFYDGVTVLEDELTFESRYRAYSLILCWALVVRLIRLTSAHPRTAMLVNTFLTGLDDLWHFFLLFTLIFCAFALLGRMLFGHMYREFTSVPTTFQQQLFLLLGELPEDFQEDVQYIVFVLVYVVVMYFFVVNFLLAIIVESYLAVKERVEKCEEEQAFLTDVCVVIRSQQMWLRYRWPSYGEIIKCLDGQQGKLSVGTTCLKSAGSWSRKERLAFQKFYRRFHFLVPFQPDKRLEELAASRLSSKVKAMERSERSALERSERSAWANETAPDFIFDEPSLDINRSMPLSNAGGSYN